MRFHEHGFEIIMGKAGVMKRPKEKLRNAKVKFYSGYKGQEVPVFIIISGTEYPIDEIISQKRICDRKTGTISEIFECRSGSQHFWIEISGSSVSVMAGKDRPLIFPAT